jgi:pyruvate oxidase
MVGHSNLGLADALRVQEQAGTMSFYGIRHEGAASFACSAYGKLTGRPAACLSIAGPGATNLLTGLWDANVDRAPAIALTGQVETQVLGPGAFQEVDLGAAFGKVARGRSRPCPAARHVELVNLACKNAILNRGVSHLIFPDEVPDAAGGRRTAGRRPAGRITPLDITPPASAVASAAQLLAKAKRPVIVVGHGARFAWTASCALAEQLNCPVITTFKGKGQIADDPPARRRRARAQRHAHRQLVMNESDCLLVFGASFSNHTGITPKKPIIQVDFDAMMLGKFHPVELPVLGRDRHHLRPGAARPARHGSRSTSARSSPSAGASGARRRNAGAGRPRPGRRNSAAIFAALSGLPADAIMAVDVGNNTYSFGRYFECERPARC